MVGKGHTFKKSLCGATVFSEWAGCVRHLYENSLQCHRQLKAPGSTVLLQSTNSWTLLVKFWPWGYFHLDFLALFGELSRSENASPYSLFRSGTSGRVYTY